MKTLHDLYLVFVNYLCVVEGYVFDVHFASDKLSIVITVEVDDDE